MKFGLLIGAGAAALCIGAAHAEDAAAAADEDIALAQLDEITVYATRNPMPAFNYPGQVTVVDQDVIRDFNPSTIADIFDAVPGASFDSGPRRTGDMPTIRGLSGEGVLVIFDGARQSFQSGHDGRFFVDPDLVRAVEVVRGPTSALYGSGALGGVIAVRTITAEDVLEDGETAGITVGGGFQSVNDEWRSTATGVWRTADNKVDVVGNFTLRGAGDIDLGNGLSLAAEDQILSSLLKTTVRPSSDLTLSASWMRYGGDSVDPSNPQGVNVAGADNAEVDRDIESDTVQGTLNYNPASDLIDLNLVGYYAGNNVTEDEIESTRILTRDVETVGVSLDNRSTFTFSDAATLTFTYGGEYYRDEQTGTDNTSGDGTRGGVPNATSRFYGAFIQGELGVKTPVGEFTLLPGVRWDRFENEAVGQTSTEDEAVSPKIGASWKPVDALILFGNWSEAFRAPSYNEIYADYLHFQIPNLGNIGPYGPEMVSNFFIPNPDLVPEESETWEAGAGVDLSDLFGDGDSFTAKASYYHSDVDNLIDLEVNIPFTCFLTADQLESYFPPCGSGEPYGNYSRNVNVANAEIEGVAAEAQYHSRYFYLRANYSTIDGADIDSGDPIGALTPDMFFADAGIKFHDGALRLGGRVRIAGDFTEVSDASEERDGYTVGDVYLVWRPMQGPLEGLRVDLGVDNVTDADYEIVAAGVSQPGRNVKVALSWRQGF